MKLTDFSYELPEELIAQTPAEERDSSRLMVLRRGGSTEHSQFSRLPEYLRSGDCLVLNDSRVLPARLYGIKSTGARVEFVLLRRSGDCWLTLVRPGRRALPGDRFDFGGVMRGEVVSVEEEGLRLLKFMHDGEFLAALDKVGVMPLPPYIRERLQDGERYQTVYSKLPGSAAAPTAGLHFTGSLLEHLRGIGVMTAFVTLHVGLGTFRPVKTAEIERHKMHVEYYEISEAAAETVNAARRAGGRVIAVGTTGCRVLESASDPGGEICARSGWTDIFIYPGYEFKATDGLITNFHLPESTLLMLVSAMAGRERILAAYAEAIRQRYRFFSFGDAMLII